MKNYGQTRLRDVIQHKIWVLILWCALATLSGQAVAGQAGFRWLDVTAVLGIASPKRLPPSGRFRLPEDFRGRAVPFDFDSDGDLDLLLTYGPHVADSLYSGLNRLYRHDDTAWVDVTAQTGLARFPPASNAAVGDVDGDGYLDLYLCRFGSDLLLRNDGGQYWHDITDSAGLANEYWATEAVFFDANRDGYLDLYVANYLTYSGRDTLVCLDPETRRRTYCDHQLYEPAPNQLFMGDSSGRFHELTAAMGLADTTSRSLAVELLDANSDGRLDLFILSHRSPNLLYLSSADTGFVEADLLSGAALAPDGSEPEWSQVLTLDANRDGHTDLLLTHRDSRILLLLNDGRGLFFEGHYQTGLFQPRFPYRATTAAAADLDFNGTTDLLLADTGHEHVRARPAADTTKADSTMSAQDSSFFVQDSAFTAATAEPSVETRDEPSDKAQDRPRRILLADEELRFQAVQAEVPMILDTTLLVPRVFAEAGVATSLDFLSGGPLGPEFFPLPTDEEPSGPPPLELPVEPEPVDTMVAPTDKFPDQIELDSLAVYQEAERFVLADLTGDGVAEVIATYPVGLFRVWRRELSREPRFIGLWPRTDRPGATAIGAEIVVTASRLSRRFMVTDPNPIMVYFPRRARSVEVLVRWPDGLENRYRLPLLNHTYTLSRMEPGP